MQRLIGLLLSLLAAAAYADETCNSPYIAKLIKGQEDYVYVWTLGVEGLGDGSDKLVTVDVNPKSKTLRQGDPFGVDRRARRGAPHGVHRRPAPPLGGRARRQPHLGVRHRDRSRQAEDRADPLRPGREIGLARTAHLLCDAGKDAGAGALQHEGQGRTYRHGALQQQGQVHRLLRHADRGRRRRLRLRPRREPAEEPAPHLELHRLRQLHAPDRRADGRCRGDEELRRHHGGLGPEGHEAHQGVQRARGAARDPLVAQRRRTTGRSPRPRSPRSSGSSSRKARNGWPRRWARSATQRRSRCRWTSASRATARACGSTPSATEDALLRPVETRGAEADLREGHRQAGQHDLAELGRQAPVHHLVAARELGQGQRRQRAVPARLRLERQGARAEVRDRLHEGKARPRAPHEARRQGLAQRE